MGGAGFQPSTVFLFVLGGQNKKKEVSRYFLVYVMYLDVCVCVCL